MEYLPTFPFECGRLSPNVGEKTIHGSYGLICRNSVGSVVLPKASKPMDAGTPNGREV